MYRVPAVVGPLLDEQPAPPRRISGLTTLLTVASGLDGGSYILGGALFVGLASWLEISAPGQMLGVFAALSAVGLGCLALVAYRVVTLATTARIGIAVAVQATQTPTRVNPTFTPWGDMSGIGDRQGAGAYEVTYRAIASAETGSIRLQEAWVRSLDTGSPLWLLTSGRHRLLAPRNATRPS